MSVANLRLLNETTSLLLETCNPDQVKIDLSKELSLNEAYFGKDPMKDVQTAMSECLRIIKIDRMMDITSYPCNKALEKACENAFGFKRVHIIWNDSIISPGICTILGSRIVPYTKAAALRLAGRRTITESPIGYYNKQHDLICYICLDSHDIVSHNFTDEEAVALLLHEIGHNFDYTFATFLSQFTSIYVGIDNALRDPEDPEKAAIIQAGTTILANFSPVKGVIAALTHIDTWITSNIPVLGELIRLCGDILGKGLSVLSAIVLPRALVKSARRISADPTILLNVSISALNTTLDRHSEYYADSFSASYGYGPYLISAIEKLSDETSELRADLPVLNCFWTIAELEQELTDALYVPIVNKRGSVKYTNSHGSSQQRAKSILTKLQAELKDPHLTPEMKMDIQRELDETYHIYNEYIMKPNSKAVELFRKFMDLYMTNINKIPLLSKIVQKNRA